MILSEWWEKSSNVNKDALIRHSILNWKLNYEIAGEHSYFQPGTAHIFLTDPQNKFNIQHKVFDLNGNQVVFDEMLNGDFSFPTDILSCSYSTTVDAALKIVDSSWDFQIKSIAVNDKKVWKVEINHEKFAASTHEHLPSAICLAVLDYYGVDSIDTDTWGYAK